MYENYVPKTITVTSNVSQGFHCRPIIIQEFLKNIVCLLYLRKIYIGAKLAVLDGMNLPMVSASVDIEAHASCIRIVDYLASWLDL